MTIQPIPSHSHNNTRVSVAMPAQTNPTIAMDTMITRGDLLLQVLRQQAVPARGRAVGAPSIIRSCKPFLEKTFQGRMHLIPASLPKDRRRLEKHPRGGRLDRTPLRGATGNGTSHLQLMLHIGMLRQQDRGQEHLSHLAMSCHSCTKTLRLVTRLLQTLPCKRTVDLAECFTSESACNTILIRCAMQYLC